MKIITNNLLVQSEYPDITEYIDDDVSSIYTKARDYIHLGAELVSHPQSGNLSADENPYKSLVIKEKDEYTGTVTDFFSLTLIENAIEQLPKEPKATDSYENKILEDFKIIDLDLIKSCVENMI